MTVDSGASEIVVGEDMIAAVEAKEGPASRKGVVYEVANGVRIPARRGSWGSVRKVWPEQ